MSSLLSNNYIANRPIEIAMQDFARRFTTDQQVLDIGCGRKPYAKFFGCKYLGADPLPAARPDVVALAWDLPFKDNRFDGIIMNQSLEHISNTNGAIAEVSRLLKPGGYAIITVPQTMKNHSHALPSHEAPVHNFEPRTLPYWQADYYRFTKFGLAYLFQKFQVISIHETNGYFGSIFQLSNYFFASLGNNSIFIPIYVFNNIVGTTLDGLVGLVGRIPHPLARKFHQFVFTSLTINLIMVVKKPEL